MNIGLLGFGVVGGGVLELTQSRNDLTVSRVLLRSPKPGLPEGLATYDFNDILCDERIDTVVEVMGGLHPAYEYVTAAMMRGKNVVTANKALIAAYYRELTALAREKGVALRCTAAVGGGIPWLVNLARIKRLDTVCAVGGIMNGTTNFIMDAMHRAPVDFPAILKEAQALGCNKIALGHHFNDVIETTLMSMLYGAEIKTMLPKLHSTNFPGMVLIRPLYCVREEDIIAWKRYNDLEFIQCACRFTERTEHHEEDSARREMKRLIAEMKQHNKNVDINIFRSMHNVNLATAVGYRMGDDDEPHSFLEKYNEKEKM